LNILQIQHEEGENKKDDETIANFDTTKNNSSAARFPPLNAKMMPYEL